MFVHKKGVVSPFARFTHQHLKVSFSYTSMDFIQIINTCPQIQPLITSRPCSLLKQGKGVCDLRNLFSCQWVISGPQY